MSHFWLNKAGHIQQLQISYDTFINKYVVINHLFHIQIFNRKSTVTAIKKWILTHKNIFTVMYKNVRYNFHTKVKIINEDNDVSSLGLSAGSNGWVVKKSTFWRPSLSSSSGTSLTITAQPFDLADSPRELYHTQLPGKQQISLLCFCVWDLYRALLPFHVRFGVVIQKMKEMEVKEKKIR